jgi:hypothetical protein
MHYFCFHLIIFMMCIAHQSHCFPLAMVGGRGYQIEQHWHETQIETLQIYQARQHLEDGINTQLASVPLLEFLIIKGIKTAMPMCAPCDVVTIQYIFVKHQNQCIM